MRGRERGGGGRVGALPPPSLQLHRLLAAARAAARRGARLEGGGALGGGSARAAPEEPERQPSLLSNMIVSSTFPFDLFPVLKTARAHVHAALPGWAFAGRRDEPAISGRSARDVLLSLRLVVADAISLRALPKSVK